MAEHSIEVSRNDLVRSDSGSTTSSLQNEAYQFWDEHRVGIMVGAGVAAAMLGGAAGMRALGKIGGAAENQSSLVASEKLGSSLDNAAVSRSGKGTLSDTKVTFHDEDSLHMRYYGRETIEQNSSAAFRNPLPFLTLEEAKAGIAAKETGDFSAAIQKMEQHGIPSAVLSTDTGLLRNKSMVLDGTQVKLAIDEHELAHRLANRADEIDRYVHAWPEAGLARIGDLFGSRK